MKISKHRGTGPLKVGATEEFMQTNPEPSLTDYVFGTRPVLEALESGKEINKILVLKGAHGENTTKILQWAQRQQIPHQKVPMEKLNKITKKNHQGVIALLSPIHYDKLDVVVPELFEQGANPLVLVLDQITDVRNLGAICRSAECMGAQIIVIPEKGGALINSDAVKTSAGAIFNLKICKVPDLVSSVKFLKNSGLHVIACTEKGNKMLHEATFSDPAVILLGSEDTGITPELMKLANQQVKIPMTGKTQSLNVAVSAGVVLYECIKQRSVVEN